MMVFSTKYSAKRVIRFEVVDQDYGIFYTLYTEDVSFSLPQTG